MTNHEGHKKLWTRLGETGSADKDSTFYELFPETDDDDNCCFACIATDSCELCPIEWGEEKQHPTIPNTYVRMYCTDDGSPYEDWYKEKDVEKRKELAMKIANLPWEEK